MAPGRVFSPKDLGTFVCLDLDVMSKDTFKEFWRSRSNWQGE